MDWRRRIDRGDVGIYLAKVKRVIAWALARRAVIR
jgi:hypothetical protein